MPIRAICLPVLLLPSTIVFDAGRAQNGAQLIWPDYILQIPAHRVIHVNCPCFATSFSLIAIDLVPVLDGAEGHAPAVVNQLS